MHTMKQFRSALFLILAIAALFLLPGCPPPTTPPSTSSSCNRPNPIVTLNIPNLNGFGVTPDTLAPATKVVIEVSGSTGNPDTTFLGQPGVMTVINLDSSFLRPLQLKFIYKTSNDETIAEDQLRIDDTRDKGVTLPDMDVVMGVTGFPSCPGTTQAVNVNTNNGVSVFNWNVGDNFEVLLTYNGTTSKFRIHPEAASDSTRIFERPSQACLSDITTQAVSRKEMAITSISNSTTVKSYNDGTIRTITIKHPVSATIVVNK